ncbi:MAG TPA: CDP-glycerol glycerophosphotransferase family protein, partial [Bacillales bacterium]|nr:CDP-glycerol glycerophosphotransferase family protein [Bacillales bacterium]
MNKNVLRKGLRMAGKPLMDRMLKPTHTRVCRFAAYYENINVDENAVLYESRDGNSVTGNPYAIFRYLLHQPGYDHLMHYWSVNDPDRLPEAIAEYGRHPNVKFVKRHTKRYLKCLAGCRYLINNSTFPSYFIPKKEQIYMNTWHGTPLKQMGFDIPGNPALSQNVVRNFLSADYLLSPNRHTTKMYTDSYKLNGLYEGEIIEEGYPRIDLTLNADRGQVLHSLMMNGVTLEKRKPTILYAPTWKRDDRFGVKADLRRLMADVNHLQKEIGDAYNLLLKVHPFMYKEAVTREAFADKLVPDCVDANELLAAVDVLITDYSSIFFDFLTTGRPVLFYVPDIEEYLEERGHTIDYAQWPGPLLFHSEQLVKAVRNLTDVKDEYEDRYAAMRNEYCRNEDGNVCARIVDYVFTGNHRPLHTVSCRKKRKEKILIYAGGMRDNGITSSFINLMDNIDHNRYDVSCFTATPHQEEVIKNIHRVNRNARWLFKPGLPLYRLGEQYQDKWIHFRGVDGRLEKKLYPHKAYEREHQRLFGNSQFDYVIDFSGYSLYWAKHLVAAKTGGKLCFMHNDLLSDSERTVNGKKPHKINLHGLFSIYDRFDKLISVSKGTMELNRDKLSRYADKAKFTYVMNSINPETILNLANDEDKPADIPDQKFAGWTTEPFRARGELVSGAFGGVRCSLLDHPNAAAVETHDRLRGEELEITRAAHHDGKRYYKVHRNGRHAGWLEADAVTLLPNRVISERKVDKIAKVRKGWPIYTLPIGVKGAEFIADSDEFHNRIVVISKEADTFEGEFARFAVDGK